MTLPQGTLLTPPPPGAEELYANIQQLAGMPSRVSDATLLVGMAVDLVRYRMSHDGRLLAALGMPSATTTHRVGALAMPDRPTITEPSGPITDELTGEVLARWFEQVGGPHHWGRRPSRQACDQAAAELNRRGLAEFERRQVAAQAEADRVVTALEREATEDREARLRAIQARVAAELAELEGTPASPPAVAERAVPTPPKRLWQR